MGIPTDQSSGEKKQIMVIGFEKAPAFLKGIHDRNESVTVHLFDFDFCHQDGQLVIDESYRQLIVVEDEVRDGVAIGGDEVRNDSYQINVCDMTLDNYCDFPEGFFDMIIMEDAEGHRLISCGRAPKRLLLRHLKMGGHLILDGNRLTDAPLSEQVLPRDIPIRRR